MEWVKLYTKYPRDEAIAVGTDAAEVMFSRGLAYCGEAETSGFIPDAVLHTLTRRPAQARKIAQSLVPDLWERVPGGYRVINWHRHQAELELLLERRRRDADRQRRKRQRDAMSRDNPRDASRDISRDCHAPIEEEEEIEAAAAAKGGSSGMDLSPTLDVLRCRMATYTALSALRWDTLTTEQATDLEELVFTHGDARLVDVAIRTCRTPPPISVTAFLGTWKALPTERQRLRAVEDPKCPHHPWEQERGCRACASERNAGER